MYNNKQLLKGFLAGLVGPMFIIMMVYAIRFGNNTFGEFVDIAARSKTAAPILALSVLADLGLFFLFLSFDKLWASRGVMISMLIYGALIIYFKFYS